MVIDSRNSRNSSSILGIEKRILGIHVVVDSRTGKFNVAIYSRMNLFEARDVS